MDAIIRTADAEDLPAIVGLYEQLAEGRPSARPTADRASHVYERIEQQHGHQLLVALVDGSIRRTADILVVPNLTHNGKPWMIVENVVVDVALRSRGIGRALMADVLRRARDAGCYKIQLLSRKGRAEAHAFYNQQGLEPVAEGFRRYLD